MFWITPPQSPAAAVATVGIVFEWMPIAAPAERPSRRASGDADGEANSLHNLGDAALHQGAYAQAAAVDPGWLAALSTDIDAIIGECRFSDCGHSNEPGCAILAALEEGLEVRPAHPARGAGGRGYREGAIMSTRIGFIGLGIMGGPMAANAAKAGLKVRELKAEMSVAAAMVSANCR